MRTAGLPSEDSDGRTVVLCHGNAANISFYHPYYLFLHDAGFHVFLFDYRGFGRSRDDVSVDALFGDTEAALQHVFARPEVDRGKVVLFGMSLGAIPALDAAARNPELAGLVIKNASNPHAALQRGAGGFLTFWAELLALPGGMEPADNARLHQRPARRSPAGASGARARDRRRTRGPAPALLAGVALRGRFPPCGRGRRGAGPVGHAAGGAAGLKAISCRPADRPTARP
jgi:alpha-beta hydrolase superfamily lysophospholipase